MKAKRHAKILEFIQQNEIETQDEILARLKACGFDVTQATISRDIKELRLVKTLSPGGKYRYTSVKKDNGDMSAKFYTLFLNSITNIDYAGNTVVLRCYSGMAQAVCAAMDAMEWEGLVGTLAGDDTIFVLFRTEEYTVKMVQHLKKLFAQ